MRNPLAVPFSSRDGTASKGSKMVNSFPEIRGESLSGMKRPGVLDLGLFAAAGQAQAFGCWDDSLCALVGNQLLEQLPMAQYLERRNVWNEVNSGGFATHTRAVNDLVLCYTSSLTAPNGATTGSVWISTNKGLTFSELTTATVYVSFLQWNGTAYWALGPDPVSGYCVYSSTDLLTWTKYGGEFSVAIGTVYPVLIVSAARPYLVTQVTVGTAVITSIWAWEAGSWVVIDSINPGVISGTYNAPATLGQNLPFGAKVATTFLTYHGDLQQTHLLYTLDDVNWLTSPVGEPWLTGAFRYFFVGQSADGEACFFMSGENQYLLSRDLVTFREITKLPAGSFIGAYVTESTSAGIYMLHLTGSTSGIYTPVEFLWWERTVPEVVGGIQTTVAADAIDLAGTSAASSTQQLLLKSADQLWIYTK